MTDTPAGNEPRDPTRRSDDDLESTGPHTLDQPEDAPTAQAPASPPSPSRQAPSLRPSSGSPVVLSGRYEMGEVIGRGGMAEVHRGRDLRLGRTVAIKALRVDLVTDETFQARFRREAQSSASLNHPNIVAVYDTGESDINGVSVPYIIMEYVEGQTLRELLRQDAGLATQRSLEITADILRALDYSHRAGIVHRDIKPGNVMVTETGQVKVMDFGIARAMGDAHQTMTQTSMVVGTAQYLSPEQARGETADARSDLYATGCVLYELLTGRPPFVGDSLVSVAMAHVKETPVPPSALNPSLTPSMDAVVLTALAKDRLQRYQSAAEMRVDVERARDGMPVAAVTPAPGADAAATALVPGVTEQEPEPRKPSARRYVLTTLGVIIVLGLAGLAGWALFQPSAEQVRVPNVFGQTLTEAQNTLDERGLRVGSTTERPDPEAEAGTVVEQTPTSGELVDPESSVDLVLSTGRDTTLVPDVVGLSVADARPLLTDAGLEISEVREEPSDDPEGTVLEVQPPEGSEVDVGSSVVLVASSGTIEVPNVEGLPEAEATAILNQAGFQVLVNDEESAAEDPGTVLFQAPAAGTEVSVGSRVAITVAVEPAPVPTEPPATPAPTTPTTPAPDATTSP
jgi:beta-lactam-binding protein with PASTA domain/tRNA A-37 threonylcarbamoyl transferase component Bud32